MSKLIYVQAQADHIASLSKAAPLAAVEELVWNALDADAKEVRIEVATNALGAVESVKVADDGTGIDILKADSTFGFLGGSWKMSGPSTAIRHRRLHGRHGRGRFKAFALGAHAEWRTTVRVGGELLSYRLSGEASAPGVFTLDSVGEPGPATGTEVFVDAVNATCDSLLDAAETVQSLSSKFALYLKSYPDVRIYFNGLPVTPVIVQRKTSSVPLALPEGMDAKLEVIEWKGRFAGSGRLVFTGSDGFMLHEVPAGARSGGRSFTAYLTSPRFPALAEENALAMDELHPEVRAYLDAAKKALKAHFAAEGEDRAAGEIGNWIREGSYPFEEDDRSKERDRFDSLALEVSSRFDGFADLAPESRSIVLRLLKHAMASVRRGTLKEFLK